MPFSPEEFRLERKKNSKSDFEFWCLKIDKAILASNQYEYWFGIRGVDSEVLDQIKQTYSSLGWDTRIVFDLRDGDALVLKEKK